MYYNRREEDLRAVKSLILEAIKIGRQRCPMMTQEELLEIVNSAWSDIVYHEYCE